MKLGSVVLALALSVSGVASATPFYDSFGPLPEANWGGVGIPNDAVTASKQFYDGSNVLITIAMNAHGRYSNPEVTNDGAGTYFAGPGSNTGGAGESPTTGALWNFNTFIKVEGFNGATPKLTDYQFTGYYDFNPGLDTPPGSLGAVNLTNLLLGTNPTATVFQDSENLLFGYLAVPYPGVVTPPAGSFNPNALGEYNFGIQVSKAGWWVEGLAMDVQVVPEPTTALLLGMALMGLAARRRKS